jgi:hypothetical protein
MVDRDVRPIGQSMSDNKSSDGAVEDLSLAMIREYLHTRGYKKSLATLTDELVYLLSFSQSLLLFYEVQWCE